LNWSLDTTKTHALLEKLPKPPRRLGYYAIGFILLLLVLAAFIAGTGAAMAGLGKLAWNGAITFVLALIVGGGLAYGAGKLIGFGAQRVASSGFANWH